MKRLLAVLLLAVPSLVFGADITETINTSNGQLINQRYADMGSNFYAKPPQDVVSMSSYTLTAAANSNIKATAGYFRGITLNSQCFNSTFTYIIADAAASAATYSTIIASISVNALPTQTLQYIFDTRFFNGLSINTFSSTCPVTAVWR